MEIRRYNIGAIVVFAIHLACFALGNTFSLLSVTYTNICILYALKYYSIVKCNH